MLEFIQAVGPALLAVGVPLVVAAIKGIIPSIPKAVIPVLAAVIGPAADLLIDAITGINLASPEVAALVGLAGIGIREVVDQVTPAIKDQIAPMALAFLLLGGAGTLTACGTVSAIFDVPAPDPNAPKQTIAGYEATFQAAVATAVQLTEQGVIVKGTPLADKVLKAKDAARAALDTWAALPDSTDRKTVAIAAITALQSILNELAVKEGK